jgi:Holliday junction resolvasome RuvABC DNA-binding subunit
MILLFRVLKQFVQRQSNVEKLKEYDSIMNYMQKIDKNTKELMDNMKKPSDYRNESYKKNIEYSNEVEKLESLGFSKEEIAKKTNKSIREVELILRLKRG